MNLPNTAVLATAIPQPGLPGGIATVVIFAALLAVASIIIVVVGIKMLREKSPRNNASQGASVLIGIAVIVVGLGLPVVAAFILGLFGDFGLMA